MALKLLTDCHTRVGGYLRSILCAAREIPAFAGMTVLVVVLSLTGCIEFGYEKARIADRIYERQKWKQLAKEGDAEAQYKVGTLYCCGERPKYDNAEALKWFCKAAKQGQRDALYAIGEMYENSNEYAGNIVPQDPVSAHVYYSLAEQQGHKDAGAMKKAVAITLSREQKKESEMLQKRWPNILCEVTR